MGLLNRHTGGSNGYGMDSTFGSGRGGGKWKKRLLIATAVILLIVIGTSAGLNIAVLLSDDDDDNDNTTITYLNVQAIDLSKYSGASDDATLISVGTSFRATPTTDANSSGDSSNSGNSDSADSSNKDDDKPKAKNGAVPIEGLSVTCNPYTQTKDGKFKSAKETAKKDGGDSGNGDDASAEASGLSFTPTDATGCSKIPINNGGTGVLTMSTGNDAYYGITNGIPTKHCTLVNSGHKWSTYDSYTYLTASDTGTSYNLDNSSPSTAKFSFGAPLDKQQNSPSDTWHIAGYLPNSGNSVKMNVGTLVYCVSSSGCSYGAAIIGDNGNGSGGGSMADLFMPFNKYYGKYGITQHGPNDDGGHVGEGHNLSYRKAVVWAYVQSKGIGDPQAWNNAVYSNNPDNKLYKLDDSGDQINGQPRGMALKQMSLQDQAWPAAMTGGASSSSSSGASGSYYRVSTEMSGKSGYKLADDDKGSSVHGLGTDMFDISSCYGSEAVVNPGKISGQSKYVLLFWITVETAGATGAGDLSGVDVTAPQYIENNHGGINPMRCDARHIPVAAGSGPNKYIPCKGSALPDCTSWAWGRYYDVHHIALQGGGWPSNPGQNNKGTLKKVKGPVAGGFVTWSGHIAFIESVNGGNIMISESGSTFCNQNVNKGLPHPWYQVVTFNSVGSLAAHIKGEGKPNYWA